MRGLVVIHTGNDLARVLRWGPGYAGQSLSAILHQVAEAEEVGLDRCVYIHVDI